MTNKDVLKAKIELPLGPQGGKRTMTVEDAITMLLHRIKNLEEAQRPDVYT